MTYFNFVKIAPPAPNDPLVDEQTQLNDNWDHFDSKMTPYVFGGTLTNVETGQEFFSGADFRFAVWNGTSVRLPDNIDSAWSAWNAMPILSPRVQRPGFTFRWRTNSLLRMVELSGGVLFDSSANAWGTGLFTINSDTSGAIPASFTPVGGQYISSCATALTGGVAQVAGGYVIIDKPGGNTFVRVRAQYEGGPGGGNFMMYDQVWWWY